VTIIIATKCVPNKPGKPSNQCGSHDTMQRGPVS